MSIDSPVGKPPLAVIVGPTASGKSALALELARRIPATIINCDSAQVYRELSVLSARPSADEMAQAPHRLYGYIEGSDPCSAPRWAADAKVEIAAAHAEGRLPVLVGGTGLYVRTLLDGIAPVPEIDPDIRASVRAMPVQESYAQLAIADPDAAQRLNANDTTRIARALEVALSTGRTLSEWQLHKQGGIGNDVAVQGAVLLPDRDWLYERIDRRFGQMLEQGAIEEVEALLPLGLHDQAPVMRAIGVPEIRAMLDGEISRQEAIERGAMATRQYAKRQYTWFRNQSPTAWRRVYEELNNSNTPNIVSLFQY